jgi:Asp-tRNA(Asn)/Glu-tRNA(Gln) amidotransferase C subunit
MADGFLWKKVSESEMLEIKKQAKDIMNSFSDKLGKIDLTKIKDVSSQNNCGFREEGDFSKIDIDRKIMFDNAPKKNENFIIGEKGDWK